MKKPPLSERVDKFLKIQQLIAESLGLAVPMEHGKPMVLYDIWSHQLIEVSGAAHTRITKEKGTITVEDLDRGEKDVSKTNMGKQRYSS